jgi:hypothetical protein
VNAKYLLNVFSIGLVCIANVSCGGSSGPAYFPPQVDGVEPAVAHAGQKITIYGHHFLSDVPPNIIVGGTSWPTDSYTDSEVKATIPAQLSIGGAAGVFNKYGVSQTPEDFAVGTDTIVSEIEPNDWGPDKLYGNKTQVFGNRGCSGTLSGVSDNDHFGVGVLVLNHSYRFHVAPKLVSSIQINEQPYNLDTNGDAIYQVGPHVSWLTLGITGGTGPYTITWTLL